MERKHNPLILLAVLLLGIFIGVAGGALSGGATAYLISSRQLAQFAAAQPVRTAANSTAPATTPQTSVIPTAPPAAAAPLVETGSAVMAVQKVGPAVVTVISRTAQGSGSGSGVIVSDEGYIITNNHVVEGSRDLAVVFADNSRREAELIGTDPLNDIAVIRVSGELPAVAVVGNSVTAGVVSALNRSVGPMEGLIQTDAAINSGNSGGPLINLRGEVVGINTLVVRNDLDTSFGAAPVEGLGFAVPSSIFRNVADQLISTGEVRYPFLGVRYLSIDGNLAAELGLPVQNGALIQSGLNGQSAVEPGSAAAQAGIRDGDIIVAVNGARLDYNTSLRQLLLRHAPGDTVTITVLRDGTEQGFEVTLGQRDPNM
jgi:S1-C subfamily serine protease